MAPFEYHRPKTLPEALALAARAQPLAGGTRVVPQRTRLKSVIDLQDLGLSGIQPVDGGLQIGAMTRLQNLLEARDAVPEALARACRSEARLNLRNLATVAGTLISADGRSPVATVLLALQATALLEPGSERVPLDSLFDRRGKALSGKLVVAIRLPQVHACALELVARSPLDRPIVCASAALTGSAGPDQGLTVALGGYGDSPRLVQATGRDPSAWRESARRAYADAGDAWAAAEYRSEIAGILVGRVVRKVLG